ncbi:hypothetical protein FNJ84_06905 [Paracoccus sp. M683]|uniref:hypothetical protein n=1 Tax=Paracoccus sp. M683 TaxID=2594268 RepID=UPI00117CB25B|nr:hypothetical protein [Paracoccus sp. M683]TRW97246.1 hypothetical protein FNJ84_06905 [Paracoccus sp. M683]
MARAASLAQILVVAAAFTAVGIRGFSQSESGPAAAQSTAGIAVGDILPADQVHIITEPGLYGLGRNVGNSEYAVASGQLIRVDPKTMKVLSILRSQSTILD